MTVRIGTAHLGDVVYLNDEQLADPWYRAMIARGVLDPADEGREDAPVSAQEAPGDASTPVDGEPVADAGTSD